MVLLEEELRYLMVHQTVQLDPTGIFSLRRLSLGSMDDGCGARRTTTTVPGGRRQRHRADGAAGREGAADGMGKGRERERERREGVGPTPMASSPGWPTLASVVRNLASQIAWPSS
jgi:hypothetical protein